MPNTKRIPAARSLQEWMERTGTTTLSLVARVKSQTGRDISPTMMSFILRRSRRCSQANAIALHAVTGVPIKVLTKWPKVSDSDNVSGSQPSHAA
jgi:hypothetical protein